MQSESKHTPERLLELKVHAVHAAISRRDWHAMEVAANNLRDDPLLRAAPRLLEALQAFMPELDQRERFISANDSAWGASELAMLDRIRKARAALAKAGET